MNIRKIVDEMGDLKAEIAPLLDRFEELKAKLLTLGPDLYGGRRYDARITFSNRTTVNADKLRVLLTDRQLSLVQQTTQVVSVTVRAKLLAPAKAA